MKIELDLSKEDVQNIILALNCRNNIIETGDYSLSASDVKRIEKGKINSLTTDQMYLILRTRSIIEDLYDKMRIL